MEFKVGVTRDLITASGQPAFNAAAFDELKANSAIGWEWLPERVSEITPDIAARYDGLHVSQPRVTAASVARPDCRLKIVARNGVGYDSVDVGACTTKGIAVTNTPLAVRRPVAVATLTLLFALAGRLFQKDQLVRTGRWNERNEHMGLGLTSRTIGLVGVGGIGREIMALARPFFRHVIAADPHVEPVIVEAAGGRLVSLMDVMIHSDFVVVCCLLNEETHHLIDTRMLAAMKPSAFLINVARGPIVDEKALIAHLQAGRIAGAGLDVAEQEPVARDNPLLSMANVIMTPHALCWTDECFEDIARTALRSIVDVSLGRRPQHLVDPSVWKGEGA